MVKLTTKEVEARRIIINMLSKEDQLKMKNLYEKYSKTMNYKDAYDKALAEVRGE